MDKALAFIMEQLNQISVRGCDVERLCEVKRTVLQIQNALLKAKQEETKTE